MKRNDLQETLRPQGGCAAASSLAIPCPARESGEGELLPRCEIESNRPTQTAVVPLIPASGAP